MALPKTSTFWGTKHPVKLELMQDSPWQENLSDDLVGRTEKIKPPYAKPKGDGGEETGR